MSIFSYVCFLFFVFYLINYAELTEKFREAVFPILPKWLGSVLSCATCFSFWVTSAFCYFIVGFSPIIFQVTVVMTFTDLLYKRLRNNPSAK